MGAKQPPPRETRSEHQRFVPQLQGSGAEERERAQKEHADFLAGYRSADADFDDEYPSPPARTPRPFPLPPIDKDVAYLKVQKRLISQQRRTETAKTVAGSGKQAPPRWKTKSIHEEFVLEMETDDEEDDEDYEGEMGNEEELEEVVEMLPKETKAKGKSKAQRQLGPKTKSRTLRKPVAAQLAKETKAVRRAADEQRCISSLAAALEDADEREPATMQQQVKRGTIQHLRMKIDTT
ncbi:Hypothetical protein PHPALM_6619 [Phytophthora palmivora]|uniref:Uncharacterized protein n=1 Tax=Phytophthora palmivora TaxID=4796 RepID=A0A2P4YEE7_9STRA|nr:Hypothetical protein PHPALM_6619 [Phytophthora palmivora]